eukprot:22078_1
MATCTHVMFFANICALLMCFLALAIICDDFLVPPIELFCERYNIPDEAAGASFLAFGSSAPEIVIATIATLFPDPNAGKGGEDTGLSTVLGSAILAFGLIPAVSALQSPPQVMQTGDHDSATMPARAERRRDAARPCAAYPRRRLCSLRFRPDLLLRIRRHNRAVGGARARGRLPRLHAGHLHPHHP